MDSAIILLRQFELGTDTPVDQQLLYSVTIERQGSRRYDLYLFMAATTFHLVEQMPTIFSLDQSLRVDSRANLNRDQYSKFWSCVQEARSRPRSSARAAMLVGQVLYCLAHLCICLNLIRTIQLYLGTSL